VLSYVLGWDVLVFSFLNFRGIFFCFNYFQITFFFCAPESISCLLIFFFFVVWCFDEKNYKPEVVEQKTKPETEVSSSCSGSQQVFNNALFNFVGAISLDDFLNTGKGLFEAVERGRVDHLFLDASRIRTPCHQKKALICLMAQCLENVQHIRSHRWRICSHQRPHP